jgi:hypothetical protein
MRAGKGHAPLNFADIVGLDKAVAALLPDYIELNRTHDVGSATVV